MIVHKNDGNWRMRVDFRRLNSVTKFKIFSIPRLDETFDLFAGGTIFSSFDLAMANHQIPVTPCDVQKTSFITYANLYEMLKMPLRFLQRIFDISAVAGWCAAGPYKPNLPCLLRRSNRIFEKAIWAPRRSLRRPRSNLRDMSLSEAVEIIIVLK